MKKYLFIMPVFFLSMLISAQEKDFSGDFDKDKDVKADTKKVDGAALEEKKTQPAQNDAAEAPKEAEKKADGPVIEKGLSDDEALKDLTNAIRKGNADRTEAVLDAYPNLLDKKDKLGNTPLFNAVFANQYLVVEAIMKRKPNINISNQLGDAPIHAAAKEGNVKTLELLLKAGASVWSANSKGESPLVKAALAGKLDAVKFLLKNRAEVNTPDSKGDTPLHKAALKGEKTVVKFLLENGADPSIKNKEGQKAADMAKNPDVKELIPAK